MKKMLLIALILTGLAASTFAQQLPYRGNYEMLRKAEAASYRAHDPQVALLDSTHSYDVTSYVIRLDLNEESDNVRKAQCTIRGIALQNLDSLDLHFIGMTVDSAKYNGAAATTRRASGKLWVRTPSLGQGQSFIVDVYYHGFPSNGLFFTSTRHGDDHTYSSCEPSDTRYWLPCYDEPWDKADSSEMYCTIGANRVAVSNGRLIEVVNEGAGRYTYHWKESYPISTYLISISVAAYSVITDSAYLANDTIPVVYYAYPQDSIAAAFDLANTPDMIEFYSNRTIAYPFSGEKYAVVMSFVFNGWGAMEHQTCTTYGDALITGDRAYEWIDAHELAHMWWGDMVTCGDWRNIWLNESFATYFDALYSEYKYGYAAFQERRDDFFSSYSYEDQQFRYAIYNPPSQYLFGSVEYEKGALVIHMIRRLMGDSSFFAAMTNYGNQYKYGNATTEEIKAHFEAYYGDLDWFFNEWIYQAGHPEYSWSWWQRQAGSNYNLNITVHQNQSNAPIFKMPITFKAHFNSGTDSTFVVWDSLQTQTFTMAFSRRPTVVYFDPENDLLKEATQYSSVDNENAIPGNFYLARNYPNPFNPSTMIQYDIAGAGPISLQIFDMLGRRVKTLVDGAAQAGHYSVVWDGSDDSGSQVSSGIYLYQIQTPAGVSTRKMNLIR
jgi:aminopeptidase N